MQNELIVSGIPVIVRRRSNAKHLRISIRGNRVTLSAPKRTPQVVIKRFADSKRSWLEKHYVPKQKLRHGSRLGEVIINLETAEPSHYRWEENVLHLINSPRHKLKPIDNIVERALRERTLNRADSLLPDLVIRMGIDFENLRIAKTISRWGSCSTSGTISLSLYGAKLPDDVFKYLLIHELCHISEPNHSPKFWKLVENWEPRYKGLKKELGGYSLDLNPSPVVLS